MTYFQYFVIFELLKYERRNPLLRRLKMGLANEQRRTEQLWWTRDLIEDLIVEKSPDFLEHHKNIDELIKQYEPEILSVFSDIADLIIKKQTDVS